jgi:hypothetical protein
VSPLQTQFVLAASLAVMACAGTRRTGEARGEAVLVRLQDYRTGQRYELASEAHTDRVAYYSDSRNEAVRKVQTDEIMGAFVSELDRQGFGAHARAGRAPSPGTSDLVRWGLEIESDARQVHWLVGTRSQASEWQAFQRCRDTFLELYNITVSYQAVENASGKSYFDGQAPAARKTSR